MDDDWLAEWLDAEQIEVELEELSEKDVELRRREPDPPWWTNIYPTD